jgi:menaquinone-dependent protoporphyrinogen oxidase
VNVLVAYASKRGSTAEIAEAVASTLAESGLEVDREEVTGVNSLEPYDAVVLGSAVYMKRWRGDARRFLRRHRRALAELPFWVFSSGPVGDPAEDRPEWTEPSKIAAAAERLGARGHVVFGGRLPAEPKGKIERAMVIGVPPEFRDRRDWDEIRAWAKTVALELSALVPQQGAEGSSR